MTPEVHVWPSNASVGEPDLPRSLRLWLWMHSEPKLRADIDAELGAGGQSEGRALAYAGPEALAPCPECDDSGRVWHAGVSTPEPCPVCRAQEHVT